MHKGRPFKLEQRLRQFGPTDLYSFGWPAAAYTMTVGTYAGSSAVSITNPTPDIVFYQFDADFLGGEYRGALNGPPFTTLEVGFHFRLNSTGEDVEGWVQTWFNGQRCTNEPSSGQNHIPFIWNAVSVFPGTTGGPFWANLHATHVVWAPKVY